MSSKKYKTYNHFDSSVETISGLVESKDSKIYGFPVGSLVGFEDESGVLNLERIYKRYEWRDYEESKSDFDSKVSSDLSELKGMNDRSGFVPSFDILKTGTVLLIPVDAFHSSHKLVNKSDSSTGDRSMFHDELINITKFEAERMVSIGALGVSIPEITVLIWSRASDESDLDNGKLFNVTNLVVRSSTQKQAVNGSMSVTLAPSVSGEAGLTVYGMSGVDMERMEWTSKMIGVGDVMFLKFGRIVDIPFGEVSPSVIQQNSFDMMGIVTSRPRTIEVGALRIIVTASDLSYLLSKDNSAIYSQMIISNGKESGLKNFDGGLMRFQGKYISQFSFQRQSIEDNLRFVMDYQSRMRINADVFDAYKRRKKLDVPELSLIKRYAEGVWNAVDVSVDESVGGLRLYNSEIGNSNEPLLSQMRKACSEHFAELRTDTYGNKFYISVRKPPLDAEALKLVRESEVFVKLDPASVLSVELAQESRSYSWYKVDYDMLTVLFKDDSLRWLMPAVHFKQFADVFGDAPLIAKNQYMSLEVKSDNLDDEKKKSSMAFIVLNDLKFLIESNAYLPFTLKGSVKIRGNWGFRSGTWIELNGMMLYIEQLSNSTSVSGSISASTTLSVSRGMYIHNGGLSDYFSVIDLPISKPSDSDDFLKYIKRTLSSWKVNEDVFQRLIERRIGR